MLRTDTGRPRPRWTVTLLSALVLGLVLPALAGAATRQYTGGQTTGDRYEDEVQGAAQTQGDVWGGEQGTAPGIEGPAGKVPSVVTTPDATTSRWRAQLASLIAWIRASLWFANRE